MTPYNEREVLKLLQEESTQRKGFEMIVGQYSEQLYWQIRRMVLSHEDANDLLQNTFIKAWTNIDYFRAEAKLSTWLYRIALNECLTFLNKQRAMTTVDIDDPEAVVVQKLESDAYFSGDKIQMCLQKALQTLPEKQRMVFNLKYYQEMKYEEMSEIFGTSVGALKASYHHAVKKIEKFLEDLNSAVFFLVRKFYMLRCLFGTLYVDMRCFGVSCFFSKHKIPHPNQWGILKPQRNTVYSRKTSE